MSIIDTIRYRHSLKKEIARLQALANRGYPGHDASIALLQEQLRQSFGNAPKSSEKPFVPYSAPPGSYGLDAHTGDRYKAEQEAGGEILAVKVPVTNLGLLPAFNPFFCDADGMQLIARTVDENGIVTESSDTARIFIKINTPGGAWLPLGYEQVAQGGFKGNATVFMGTLKRFWVRVSVLTADPDNQPFLILFLLRHVSIVAPSGSSVLYGGLQNTQGQQQPIQDNSQNAPSGSGSSSGGTSGGGIIDTSGGGGGFSGGGGGGSCPLSGAPVRLYGPPELWSMQVAPCEEFIRITTTNGRKGIFSPQHRAYQRRGLLPLTEWKIGEWALTEDGEEVVTQIERLHIPNATVDSYDAKSGHVYSAWGFISHNIKIPK